MLTLPGQHRPERARDDLLALLALCARQAAEKRHPQLLSITLRVRHIDPLAVLLPAQNPRDWHAYFEHPADDTAVAGIDAAWQATFTGAARFAQARDAARALLENAVHVGDTDAPFAGPHFFSAFTFEDDPAQNSHGTHAPASLFLPRWQVARRDGAYTAVANVLIDADTPLDATADRILAAHRRYHNFEYDAESPESPETTGRPAPLPLTELGGDWYAGGVQNALRRIADGTAQKIVLGRTWRAVSPAPISLARTLEHLRERFPACHTFSFSNGTGATFLGATPERLAVVGQNQLQTEALAGTAPRGGHAGDDARLGAQLLGDGKEQREHAAVVDTLLDALQALGAVTQSVGPARLVSLPNVQHLRTPITAALPPGTHLLDIAAALHPTPAVGGVPRSVALAAIREIEPVPRGLFAGLVGWFDAAGEGRLLVGLRSALVNGTAATLFAGAGIVAGADPARELAETQAKLRAMHEALG